MFRVLFFLFFLIVHSAIAQNEYNVWYFGAYAGMDFNGGAPVELTNSAMHSLEGCATVCDKNGNILFYSDGDTIWDQTHTPMANGTDLLGDHSTTQAVKIVRKPGSANLYYVFTLDNYCDDDGLSYSIVDMNLNGGLGDVTATKNVFLHTPTSEKITIAKHQNGTDYWVITHKCLSDSFMVYALTNAGLNHTPVVSTIGYTVKKYNGDVGQLKISPDGTKLAFAGQQTAFQLLFFDNVNGWILNSIDLTLPEGGCYGIEFSPNSNLLYVNTNEAVGGNRIPRLYQFDITSGVQGIMQATRTYLSTSNSDRYLSLQLAPDGKIYQAKNSYPKGSQYLGVISDPDVAGTGCNYSDFGFKLNGGGLCLFGLPDYSPQLIDTNSISLAATISSSDVLCYGENNGSASVSVTNGTPGYTFDWAPSGGSDSVANNLAAGTYTVTITDANNNTYVDSVTIDQPNPIAISPALVDQSICIGDSFTFTGNVIGGTPGYSYSWNPGNISNDSYTVQPTSTSTYTLIVNDTNNCSTSDTVQVAVVPSITAQISPDVTICTGDSTTLTASGGSTFSWNTGDSLANITVSPTSTTTYTVTVSSGSCAPDQATVTVNVVNSITVTASKDTTICLGDSVQLLASGASSYTWNHGAISATTTVAPATTTTYEVIGTSGTCAADTDQVEVTVIQITADAGTGGSIYNGDNFTLNGAGGGNYQWQPSVTLDNANDASPEASPTLTTTYTLTVTDQYGCTATDTVTIFVTDTFTVNLCGELFIPNAFSPNGDGVNDVLYVRGDCIETLYFVIFNRWGEKVFESTNPAEGWNGIYRSNDKNTASFDYHLKATLNDGTLIEQKGTITLLQ